MANVVKMYRQVNLKEEQRDLQRILWRFDSSQPVQEYRLNTYIWSDVSSVF